MNVVFDNINEYHYESIYAFIKYVFDYFNVWEQLKKHEIILLKPNLLSISKKQISITTHPVIAEAIIDNIKNKYNKKIYIGDGGSASYINMDKLFDKAGYKKIADKYSIELINFNTHNYTLKNGIKVSCFINNNPYIINLPKLKTHMLTQYTLSIKNLYGMIPSKYKIIYHSKFPDKSKFSEFTVKVYNAISPQLNIIDGIIGMQGNGPSNGEIFYPNIIAASNNGFALDHFIMNYCSTDINNVHYMQYAVLNGYYNGQYTANKQFNSINIKMPDINKFSTMLSFAKNKFIKRIISDYPIIQNKTCKKCMKCRVICPSNAIIIKNNYPYIRDRKCLSCYCCIETCPYESINIKKSLLERIID